MTARRPGSSKTAGHRLVLVTIATLLAASTGLAQTPEASPPEDTPVRANALEGQREAYEAFQRRQADRYQRFQEQRSADYEAYMARIRASYERFVGIVATAEREERDRVAERWDDAELSSRKVWVEYSPDLSERSRVDFEHQTITIESFGEDLAGDDLTALRRRIRAIVTRDRATAFENDRVAQTVERRSREQIEELETAVVEPKPVLWPWLTGQSEIDPEQVDPVVDWLLARATIREQRVHGERLQQAEIPLDARTLLAQLDRLQAGDYAAPMPEVAPEEIPIPPLKGEPPPREARPRPAPDREPSPAPKPPREPSPAPSPPREKRPEAPGPAPADGPPGRADALPPPARPLLAPVRRFGDPRALDPALVFSIIETESAFNPLARSPAPAYGLMQIVPQSAGQDATAVLFGRPRILAPSYLYNAENNIEIGAVYLELLFSRYLEGVRDPRSRLYCVIAAYNTGAGNVFRAFTGRTRAAAALARINALSPDRVYRQLVSSLPYEETRRYLPKVLSRMEKYRP